MTNLLAPVAKAKFFDNNGRPANGYKLFTYEAGTSTKADTFPSAGAVVANANPIILDYRGEANVWIPPNVAFKFVFAPPSDTDPPTAPIWTVDDIVDSQLISLWGGVDTGIANAYVLTFDANFSAYADGIVIYWIPSNANTGASTVNVNGLGPIAIVNQDGGPMLAGQIPANQIAEILYLSGQFILLSSLSTVQTGSFAVTAAGFTAPVSGDIDYVRLGNTVTLSRSGGLAGTSNATTFVLSGLPAALRPTSPRQVLCNSLNDNSVGSLVGAALITNGNDIIMLVGEVTGTRLRVADNIWTAAGGKGIDAGWQVTYTI